MTPTEALTLLHQTLENAVNCTGPQRDRLRQAAHTLVEALAEKVEDKTEDKIDG